MDLPTEILESSKLATGGLEQLITISTTLLALSVTFLEKIAPKITKHQKRLVIAAWVLLIVCIICSVWASFAITGTIAQYTTNPDGIYGFSVVLPSQLALISFVAAIICVFIFGVKGIANEEITNGYASSKTKASPEKKFDTV